MIIFKVETYRYKKKSNYPVSYPRNIKILQSKRAYKKWDEMGYKKKSINCDVHLGGQVDPGTWLGTWFRPRAG